MQLILNSSNPEQIFPLNGGTVKINMRDPFNITVQNTTYYVYPDYDDFTEQQIFGIEAGKTEIGVLLINQLGQWEWAEGGSSLITAELLGSKIQS